MDTSAPKVESVLDPDTQVAQDGSGNQRKGFTVSANENHQPLPSGSTLNRTKRVNRRTLSLTLLALAPILVAFFVQWTMRPSTHPLAWFVFYPAVLLSAWFGGWRLGILTTVLSVIVLWYCFIPPAYSFAVANAGSAVSIIIFPAVGVGLSFFVDKLRQGNRTAAAAVERVEQAEHEIRRSEEKFRLFIENSQAAVAIFDRQMRYLAVSQRWLRDFKVEGNIIGRGHYEIFPEIPESWKEVHRRCLAGAVEEAEEDRFERADGSVYWLKWEVRPWLDSNSEIGGLIIYSEDITKRKQTEEALRESEGKYRELFESIDQGFCTVNVLFDENEKPVDYQFLVVNPAFERQTGIQNAAGRSMREIAPLHEEHWFETYGHIALTGEPKHFENRADQLHRYYDVFAWRVGEPTERRVAILFNDISERKKVEAELTALKDRLAEDLAAMNRLQALSMRLVDVSDPDALLEEILDTTIALQNADFGNVQRYDPEAGALKIVAQRGFKQDFLDYFDSVQEGQAACGAALQRRERTIIEDVELDPSFEPHRQIAASAGFRAVQSTPLFSRDGNPIGVLSTHFRAPHRPSERDLRMTDLYFRLAVEVLERRQADERLRASEARAAGIIESAMDAIITVDAGDGIVLFNQTAEKTFGCSVQEAIGQPLSRFIPDRARLINRGYTDDLGQISAARRASDNSRTISGLRANGEEFPIEVSVSQTEAGGQRLLTLILRDVTRRKRDEERLQEQAAMLDQAHEAIMIRDLDNAIRFWNQGAERMYGWKAAEAVGRHHSELLCRGDSSLLDEATKTVRDKGEWAGELRQFAKDGSELVVEAHWTLVRDEDGNPRSILAIKNDITEKKKLEAQFLRAQRLESIGTLASGIAHDLNNILSPILMAVQLLQYRLDDEDSLRTLGMLKDNVLRGGEMVKQVLSFARGTAGERVAIRPKHLINEVISILRETFPKNISINYSAPYEPGWVSADPTQMHQVLMNLCVNARDAMQAGGGSLTITAENTLVDEHFAAMVPNARTGRYVVITIADTGTGMTTEIQERIFDPFFTTKAVGRGTGLGLSTVHSIMKNHSGFVTVYSELGQGTRFHLYLPEHATTQQIEQISRQGDLPLGHGELILVVDDERAIREITQATLESCGYRVLIAADGTEAITLYAARKNEIRLVLTDMMMPNLDGPILIRALRTMNPSIEIIANSGLNDTERTREAEELGVKRFLTKPYTAQELLQALAQVFSN